MRYGWILVLLLLLAFAAVYSGINSNVVRDFDATVDFVEINSESVHQCCMSGDNRSCAVIYNNDCSHCDSYCRIQK